MSASAHSPAAERAAKLERLRLLCAADRARLRLVWRLTPRQARHEPPSEGWRGALLGAPALGALLPLVPGPIGRWSRRLGSGAGLLRAMLRAAA